jgi:RNA polymerase sigma factor (sigma-70 family)
VSLSTRAPELPEHYFRHEFGRLVSVLSRRFGMHRLELCEDAAQTALLRAVQSLAGKSAPSDMGGWLYQVARNQVIDALRREKHSISGPELADRESETGSLAPVYLEREVEDDQLRLLFICADPAIPEESQVVFALKTLCGFSVGEIALRSFHSEDAIQKRLQRARATLRANSVELDTPRMQELAERLPAVLQMIYLLFNEGYSSAQPERLIRRELCEEAVRLGLLLSEHPIGDTPETFALLSLMYLHAARFEARVDGAGGLLLLEEQDRALWDRELIDLGLFYLQRAAHGEGFSRYQVEAAIAVEHCLAPSYAETRWHQIARLYAALERVAPSPLNILNRAIALAEWQGPRAGLALLEAIKPPGWLLGYYLWDATLGELYRRGGDRQRAAEHLSRALDMAPTHAEQALLRRRLDACSENVSENGR